MSETVSHLSAFGAGAVFALAFYGLYVKAKAWTKQEEAKLATKWTSIKPK